MPARIKKRQGAAGRTNGRSNNSRTNSAIEITANKNRAAFKAAGSMWGAASAPREKDPAMIAANEIMAKWPSSLFRLADLEMPSLLVDTVTRLPRAMDCWGGLSSWHTRLERFAPFACPPHLPKAAS